MGKEEAKRTVRQSKKLRGRAEKQASAPLSSRLATEKVMLDVHRVMQGREFQTIEEANAFLATLAGPGLKEALKEAPTALLQQEAQEIAYHAMEAPKLNDANLYSSSLHLANLIQVLFRCRVNRALLTAILGAVGIGFSIAGILDHVVGFLLILGIAVPPTAGVLIVDYFVLQRDREALNATRASLSLPASCEAVNPIGLLAWAAGFLAGRFIHSGVASVNSVLVSGSVYFVFMKLMAMLEHKPVKYFSAAASMPPE
jgi:Permease for cytosine/purines, uracil, thiamine, allantoin